MLKLIIILAAVAVCYGQSQNMRVTYTLFKKGNQFNGQTIQPDSIPDIFNSTQQTIFLIHGYAGNTVERFNQLIRDAMFDYRNSDDYNVIEVDWKLEASFSYAQASNNVGNVARNLVNFIQGLTTPSTEDTANSTKILERRLIKNSQANVEKFHLVGFGLGAHVAGIAGRILQEDDDKDSSKTVGRITGLDPAGRQWGAGSERLRRGDASYVEVIHTDTSGIFANGIGDPIGDINFYANGGNNQPGCFSHSCCHDRAFELFAASMINLGLRGRGCTSKSQMNLNLCRSGYLNLGGVDLSKTGHAIYRINTSRRYPFY